MNADNDLKQSLGTLWELIRKVTDDLKSTSELNSDLVKRVSDLETGIDSNNLNQSELKSILDEKNGMIEHYEVNISGLNTQIADLRQSLSLEAEKNKNFQELNAMYIASRDELVKLKEADANIPSLLAELQTFKDTNELLQNTIDDLNKKQKEFDLVKEDYSFAQKEITRRNFVLSEHAVEIENYKVQIAELKNKLFENERSKAANALLESEHSEYQRQIEELKEYQRKLLLINEDEKKSLELQISELNSDKEIFKNRIEDLIIENQSSINAIAAEKDSINLIKISLDEKLEQLNVLLSEKQQANLALEAEKNAAVAASKNMAEQLENHKKITKEQQKAIESYSGNLFDLKRSDAENDKRIKNLNESIHHLKSEISKKDYEINKLRSSTQQTVALNDELAKLKSQIIELENNSNLYKEEILVKNQEITNLQDTARKAEEQGNEISKLKSEIHDLENYQLEVEIDNEELKKIMTEKDKLLSEATEATRQSLVLISQLNDELSSKNISLDDYNKQIDLYQGELTALKATVTKFSDKLEFMSEALIQSEKQFTLISSEKALISQEILSKDEIIAEKVKLIENLKINVESLETKQLRLNKAQTLFEENSDRNLIELNNYRNESEALKMQLSSQNERITALNNEKLINLKKDEEKQSRLEKINQNFIELKVINENLLRENQNFVAAIGRNELLKTNLKAKMLTAIEIVERSLL
ncbi:MAG: hypothetical protein NT007_02155 [Candidatus Kapabacteria bacterium]|nr:hypothetical protein [Candidatus Kapabacteria bacterium]